MPMLQFAHAHGTGLALLVNHDDAEREFNYIACAERSLERATADGWTVISVHNDWSTVFAETDRHRPCRRLPTTSVRHAG
jgi:hypothetical protein